MKNYEPLKLTIHNENYKSGDTRGSRGMEDDSRSSGRSDYREPRREAPPPPRMESYQPHRPVDHRTRAFALTFQRNFETKKKEKLRDAD